MIRERHQGLLDQAEVWDRTTAGRTRTEVLDARRQAEGTGQKTDRAAGLLHRAIPDGVDKVTKDQAVEGHERVAELLTALDANTEVLDELAALGAHLDHLEVALPAKAEILAHELPEVREMANQRVSEGWKVDSVRERLTAIQTTIGEVEEADAQLEVDLLDLSDRLERAEAQLFSVDHELQTLPDRPGSLERWSEQLDEAAEQELARADALRRQIAAAGLTHAAESWRWAVNHPEGAIEALERADDHQETALEELVPAQRFDDACAALDAAGLEMMVADDLLDQGRRSPRRPGVGQDRGADHRRPARAVAPGSGRRHRSLPPGPLAGGARPSRGAGTGERRPAGRAGPAKAELHADRRDRRGHRPGRDELLVTVDEQHQQAEVMRPRAHPPAGPSRTSSGQGPSGHSLAAPPQRG